MTGANSGGATAFGGANTAVNDAPTLSATAQNPTFPQGGAAAGTFSGATVDTIEGGQNIAKLSIEVANVADTADEVLVFDGTDISLTAGNTGTTANFSYSVSLSGSTATVSLTGGSVDTGTFEGLVDALAYRNDSDDPTTGATRDILLTEVVDTGGAQTGTPTGGTANITVSDGGGSGRGTPTAPPPSSPPSPAPPPPPTQPGNTVDSTNVSDRTCTGPDSEGQQTTTIDPVPENGSDVSSTPTPLSGRRAGGQRQRQR